MVIVINYLRLTTYSALTTVMASCAFAGNGPDSSVSFIDSAPHKVSQSRINMDNIDRLLDGKTATVSQPVAAVSNSFSKNELSAFFTKLVYAADSEDQSQYNNDVARLVADGWSVQKIKGTTGSAKNQVESIMCLFATRDKEVMIATRGTVTLNDWITDFRAERNVGNRLRGLLPFMGKYAEIEDTKSEMIAAQLLNVEGKIANGFLQTYMSFRDELKRSLMAYCAANGFKPSDLDIKTTGHSLGGALSNIVTVDLLHDEELELGRKVMEASFRDSGEDIGMSIHVVREVEDIENKNVKNTAFEGPRFTSNGEGLNKKVGTSNWRNVQNRFDPVTIVPPKFVGFQDTVPTVEINTGHFAEEAHFMSNLSKQAVVALDEHDAKQAAISASGDEEKPRKRMLVVARDAVAGLASDAFAITKYVGNKALDITKYVGNTVLDLGYRIGSGIVGAAKSATKSISGFFGFGR